MKGFAKTISALGGRAFIVGGAVRDEFMGRPAHDHDIVVVGVREEDFLHEFPKAKKTGSLFPVFRVQVGGEEVEIAFARKERKTGEGHKGFAVEFDPTVSLKDDLFRRDLTVNAIAKDILTDEIIDPFGGREAIKRKELVAVSQHFCEDPLRVLRVARQAAQFGFTVAKETLALMEECGVELPSVPMERIWGEMEKALATERPSVFFRMLEKSNTLQVVFPELAALRGQIQPEEWHPEGDAFEHTMLVIDRAAAITSDIEVRFCALFHDVGKGLTPKEMLPKHHGHDLLGADMIRSFKDGRFPARLKKAACFVAAKHMVARKLQKPGKIATLLEEARRARSLETLRQVVKADSGKDVAILQEAFVKEVFGPVAIPDSIVGNGDKIHQHIHEVHVQRVKTLLAMV